MRLNALGTADNEESIIKHREDTLRFGRKIHMTGRIKKVNLYLIGRKSRLFGEYSDAALLFKRIRIQIGISVVNAPPFAYRTGRKQKPLAKRGLSCINMRDNSDCQSVLSQILLHVQ